MNISMNVNRYANKLNAKVTTGVITALLLAVTPISSIADINKNELTTKDAHSQVDSLIMKVLKNTEQSLSLVESNTADSLQNVENAITSIRDIKQYLSPDTHVEAKSPLFMDSTAEYWFKYPQVNQSLLNNSDTYPTLNKKLQTGVLYGSEATNKSQKQVKGYFDYAFAYSSLKTARDALLVNNYREAKSSLKWVFEAVYINPKFNVVSTDKKMMIDKLLDKQAMHPFISSTQ
ncbi:MAG: hypothetical protein AB8B92_08960 [Gammaproteobacteria bacterium]